MKKLVTCIFIVAILFVVCVKVVQFDDADVNGLYSNNEISKAEEYFDYFYENNEIITLLECNEEFSDSQMAAFAVLSLKNPNFENGNSKEEFDDITEKYFGRKIENFNNSMTYIDSKSGLIKPTGWSFDSTVYMSLIDLIENEDGTKTADFYAINVGDGDDIVVKKTASEKKQDILNKNFKEYGENISIVRLLFEEKKDENGDMYLKYLQLNTVSDVIV